MTLRKLSLTSFRNHQSLTISSDSKYIVISGQNGIGKTNILEAISLLSPGRGFRNCKFDEILNTSQSTSGWAIYTEYANDNDEHKLGTGYSLGSKRSIRVNESNLKKHADILDYVRVIWLTPQMDGIFLESRSARTKFLDRLSYNFFPSHASTVSEYEKAMRSRTKLLVEQNFDDIWLSNLESAMAKNAITIAKTRIESLNLINEYLAKFTSNFLKPNLELKGYVEENLDEQIFKDELKNCRQKDSYTGRCSIGTHKSELIVIHPDKQISANQCSTGEQKAMLISLILAQTKAINDKFNQAPILLLDEIFAHLDKNRKTELIKELQTLEAQTWITCTDKNLHNDIGKNCIHIPL